MNTTPKHRDNRPVARIRTGDTFTEYSRAECPSLLGTNGAYCPHCHPSQYARVGAKHRRADWFERAAEGEWWCGACRMVHRGVCPDA